ncbi:LytR/AlgR family response regulator transcription factor [Flavivirga jejuensis]|uniref:LytTR family DNA-binding domain-containing protein n=1 Tax=Flavivirga jejuensis TaxID=870487 RepID=A0ABT8WRA4_9FLAO|nr:LytTR family DNA-binding domain-containing protein [Flavivirga jejuensis]MDO5975447.1 LytTR family DNA-binding domain-containing protein [Flavivirga jejuensis]
MKKTYTVLVVDDERLARVRLKKLIAKFSELFTIIGEAENGHEAEKLIIDLQPDIIFLDIEMPGLTGFELLKRLEVIPMVIFCTAFEDYSLKAFETNSIDYLIKPVKEARLQQTVLKIEQLKTNFSKENIFKAINTIAETKEKKRITSVTVKKGDKIVFVKLEDISHFEATEKYVTLYTNKGNELVEQSLTQLENKLPENFLRVHRSFLINTVYVKDFQKYFNNRYIISLHNHKKTVITSGRTYKDTIKNYINQ